MAPPKRRVLPDIRSMTHHQLLSHLIGLSGRDASAARELSHALLADYSTLESILRLPLQSLRDYPALGDEAAVFLHIVAELLERYQSIGHSPDLPVRVWEPEDTLRFLVPTPKHRALERVCVFCLGEAQEFISGAVIAQGGPAAVSCSVPRMLEMVLSHRSKGVILAHNHPDCSPDFSKSDLTSTSIVARALDSVRIPLTDHLLLAGNELVSLRELCQAGLISGPPFQPPAHWLNWDLPFRRMFLCRQERLS